jgi:glycosyltransferase involved in cell wall biosynthesis
MYPEVLTERMSELLEDHEHARRLGAAGWNYAAARFGIARFAREWDEALRTVAG